MEECLYNFLGDDISNVRIQLPDDKYGYVDMVLLEVCLQQ